MSPRRSFRVRAGGVLLVGCLLAAGGCSALPRTTSLLLGDFHVHQSSYSDSCACRTDVDLEYKHGALAYRSGTDAWSAGPTYTGVWAYDGRRSGGSITWPDGRSYQGDWRVVENQPDVPEGDGAMTWPDGRKYTGDFKEGVPHGLGKMVAADGTIREGLWRKGAFAGCLVPPPAPTTLPAIQ